MTINFNESPSRIWQLQQRVQFLEVILGEALAELGRAIEVDKIRLNAGRSRKFEVHENSITGNYHIITKEPK